MSKILEKLEKGRIVPVVALDEACDAVDLCRALQRGGLAIAEITFRTRAAREALKLVAAQFPEFALGAGTVTTLEELEAAHEAGAQFAVSPGFNPSIVQRAQQLGLPFFPGVMTPTDIESALALGLQVLKFFPAGAAGGPKMIKAIYAPIQHRGVRFIPTGGVNAGNLGEYLGTPGVLAVGGSWIVAKDLLAARNWDEVTRLTKEAVEVAAQIG